MKEIVHEPSGKANSFLYQKSKEGEGEKEKNKNFCHDYILCKDHSQSYKIRSIYISLRALSVTNKGESKHAHFRATSPRMSHDAPNVLNVTTQGDLFVCKWAQLNCLLIFTKHKELLSFICHFLTLLFRITIPPLPEMFHPFSFQKFAVFSPFSSSIKFYD